MTFLIIMFQVSAIYSGRRVDLAPAWGLHLGHLPQFYLDHQLTQPFESAPELYYEFIQYYGTHVFKNAMVWLFFILRVGGGWGGGRGLLDKGDCVIYLS